MFKPKTMPQSILCGLIFFYTASLWSMREPADHQNFCITYQSLSEQDLLNSRSYKTLSIIFSCIAFCSVTAELCLNQSFYDGTFHSLGVVLSAFAYSYVLSKLINIMENYTLDCAKKYARLRAIKEKPLTPLEIEAWSATFFFENIIKIKMVSYGIESIADWLSLLPRVVNAHDRCDVLIQNQDYRRCCVIKSNTDVECCLQVSSSLPSRAVCADAKIIDEQLLNDYIFDGDNFWVSNPFQFVLLEGPLVNKTKFETIYKEIDKVVEMAIKKGKLTQEEYGMTVSLYEKDSKTFYEVFREMARYFQLAYKLSVEIVVNSTHPAWVELDSDRPRLFLSFDKKTLVKNLPGVLGHELGHIKHWQCGKSFSVGDLPFQIDFADQQLVGPGFPEAQLVKSYIERNIEITADLYSILVDPHHALDILGALLTDNCYFGAKDGFCRSLSDFINEKEKNPCRSHPNIEKCRGIIALIWMEKIAELFKELNNKIYKK